MGLSIVHGLLIGASLIVAIGAQNAFVLNQGLRREHGWLVAAICAGCDLLLIAAGVAGLGPLMTASPLVLQLARWCGVGWLLWQAWRAFERFRCPHGMTVERVAVTGAGRVALATLGVTLLNPHVYLDTVVMLGLIGGQQTSPAGFVAGASLASVLWFFSLVGAGHWLSLRLKDPRWWQVIDALVAAILLGVAWQLAVRPL